jgi:hypothetical protein
MLARAARVYQHEALNSGEQANLTKNKNACHLAGIGNKFNL